MKKWRQVKDYEFNRSQQVRFWNEKFQMFQGWIWTKLMEHILENQICLCVESWRKVLPNVPELNWGLHNVSDFELEKTER